jgi:probable phosphomutase (TIGR03848 family)
VTLLLLARHGRTTANASGVLAGWTPGIQLDEVGQRGAEALGARLAPIPLAAVVTSPLRRCRQTAAAIVAARADTASGGRAKRSSPAARRPDELEPIDDERFGECRYGDWTGRELKTLAKEPMWRVVQAHPAAAVFPGPAGESLAAMSARAVAGVRAWNARIAAEAGDNAAYLVCSHGDVIKAIVADALGMHLDSFQRISVDPCSLTAIRYTELRPFLLRLNDVGGDVSGLVPPKRGRARRSRAASRASDAVVGGATGVA